MEKIIEIDGKQVPFKASARTPVLYRALFGKDIFKDLAKLTEGMKKAANQTETVMDTETLEVFLSIAYVMAKQADKSITANIDDWLDQFSVFSIYTILPELLELWNLNMTQLSEAKKNVEALTAK